MFGAHFHPERKFLEGCLIESRKGENPRVQDQVNKVVTELIPNPTLYSFFCQVSRVQGVCYHGIASLYTVLLVVFLGLRLQDISVVDNKC